MECSRSNRPRTSAESKCDGEQQQRPQERSSGGRRGTPTGRAHEEARLELLVAVVPLLLDVGSNAEDVPSVRGLLLQRRGKGPGEAYFNTEEKRGKSIKVGYRCEADSTSKKFFDPFSDFSSRNSIFRKRFCWSFFPAPPFSRKCCVQLFLSETTFFNASLPTSLLLAESHRVRILNDDFSKSRAMPVYTLSSVY